LASRNVRFGSKADIQHHTHLRPLSGLKQTLNVCFQEPIQLFAVDEVLVLHGLELLEPVAIDPTDRLKFHDIPR